MTERKKKQQSDRKKFDEEMDELKSSHEVCVAKFSSALQYVIGIFFPIDTSYDSSSVLPSLLMNVTPVFHQHNSYEKIASVFYIFMFIL